MICLFVSGKSWSIYAMITVHKFRKEKEKIKQWCQTLIHGSHSNNKPNLYALQFIGHYALHSAIP